MLTEVQSKLNFSCCAYAHEIHEFSTKVLKTLLYRDYRQQNNAFQLDQEQQKDKKNETLGK